MDTLYETDFFAWTVRQSALLRSGRLSEIDVLHIAEEIDAMGRSEKRELSSRLAQLIAHLLKWKLQPARRSRSWLLTIRHQRRKAVQLIAEMPSLKPRLTDPEWVADAWGDAIKIFADDTGIDDFPEQPIWRMQDLLDPDFLPD